VTSNYTINVKITSGSINIISYRFLIIFFFEITLTLLVQGPQEAWRDGKKLEICTSTLEFESGRVPLARTWGSRGFTRSLGSTKCTFQEVGFSQIQKKKKLLVARFLTPKHWGRYLGWKCVRKQLWGKNSKGLKTEGWFVNVCIYWDWFVVFPLY
jgi:hypothetical protein